MHKPAKVSHASGYAPHVSDREAWFALIAVIVILTIAGVTVFLLLR